jgi:hypothetical protein
LPNSKPKTSHRFWTWLTDADVGGYVAPPCGGGLARSAAICLYVDTMRYHRAEDVLMVFMRGKGRGSEVEEAAPRVVVRRSIWLCLWTALRVAQPR